MFGIPDVASLQAMSRMQNIFGAPPDPFGSMGLIGQQQQQNQGPSIEDYMRDLYQPKMDMQNRFNSMLDQFPTPQNPSMLRKIGAVLYGMSQPNSLEASTKFANMPYFHELERYKAQLGPLQQAADNERLMNAQERQFAQSTAQQRFNWAKQEDLNTKNAADLALKEKVEARRAETAKVLNYIRMNPNLQHDVVNGELILIDPRPGGQGPIPTGIKGMTDLEKAQFNADAAMARTMIQQQGATERTGMTVAGANQRNERTVQGAMDRTQYNVLNRPIRTGGSTSPNVVQNARARQAVSEHPEWAPYIKRTPSGQFIGVEAPQGSSGLFGIGAKPGGDPEIVKKINEYIFGSSPGNTVPNNKLPGSQPNTGGQVTPDLRARAEKVLRDNGKPVTPANIDYVAKQLGAR